MEKVVQEMSSGSSINEIYRRYGIKETNTNAKKEEKRLEEEKENKKLKTGLGKSIFVQHRLENLIEVVNKYYQTDIKK
jgi:hypothetical protein